MTLYEALGVSSDATQTQIRKAYLKLAAKLHPDRNDAPDATDRFQQLQKVYDILSDPKKRDKYDRTGNVDEYGEEIEEWSQFFASVVPAVDQNAIDSFFDTYQASEQEKRDLLQYYKKFSGNMKTVLEWMISYDEQEDKRRFAEIIQDAIDDGIVPEYQDFTKWIRSLRKRLQKKTKNTKKRKKQRVSDDMSALTAKIHSRSTSGPSGGILASLAEKYGEELYEEPTEEEFLAAQARLKKNR